MFLNHSKVGAPAWQIARAVQRGDTSATAVVAGHLEYAAVADRILDALRVLRAAESLAEAEMVDDQTDLADLPLAGVPVLVSENTAVAGLTRWNGSAAARAPVSDRDHEIVRRLRGAGALVLGSARMSELGLWPTTDDDSGVTRNPWRSDRSPGGSAGGVAAAVAAGVVPIAFAPDRFGSLRIPAASCGLVALCPGTRPSVGGDDLSYGVLATTVDDAALGYAVVSASTPAPLPELGALRAAISWHGPWPGGGPDGPNRAAVMAAGRVLLELGHDAVTVHPPYPARLPLAGAGLWAVQANQAAQATGGAGLQPRTRRHAALGAGVLRRGLVRPGETDDWHRRFVAWLVDGGWDVLVVPALAGPPPAAQPWSARSWRANMGSFARTAPPAVVWSLIGLPTVTVPMGRRPDGLPAAVQLVGPPGSESRLLAIAAQWELRAPWPRHAPSWPRLHAGTTTPAETAPSR
jgi:amidase